MQKTVRIYMREKSDQEYKTKGGFGPKRMKQYFKPIGWMCLVCKEFHLDDEYGKPCRTASNRWDPKYTYVDVRFI